MLTYCKKLPRMNPFPDVNSVLVMDNASIHKGEELKEIVEEAGSCLVLRDSAIYTSYRMLTSLSPALLSRFQSHRRIFPVYQGLPQAKSSTEPR